MIVLALSRRIPPTCQSNGEAEAAAGRSRSMLMCCESGLCVLAVLVARCPSLVARQNLSPNTPYSSSIPS